MTTPIDLDETAIREAFHEARLCKDGGRCHAIAHDDDDEDGDRARFMAAFHEARKAAEGSAAPSVQEGPA